jgi:carbonic anhydrase
VDVIYRYDPFRPITHRPIADAAEALDYLEKGHQRYFNIVTQVQQEILGRSAAAEVIIPSNPLSLALAVEAGAAPTQTPFALVLGCSDARVPIEIIFDQSPNDLFVVRVAGNVLGVECLGSIDYAVSHLSGSLKLVVVLGHSACGAVSAAVDSYLAPTKYAEFAFTHAVRSLVDRIHTAVRGAAHALEQAGGRSIARRRDYRDALLGAAVYLNAAITAYDVRRELAIPPASSTHVVYGVFDLVGQHVRAHPSQDRPIFAEAPQGPDDFKNLGIGLAKAFLAL